MKWISPTRRGRGLSFNSDYIDLHPVISCAKYPKQSAIWVQVDAYFK